MQLRKVERWHKSDFSNAVLTITTVRKDGVVLLRIENLQQ